MKNETAGKTIWPQVVESDRSKNQILQFPTMDPPSKFQPQDAIDVIEVVSKESLLSVLKKHEDELLLEIMHSVAEVVTDSESGDPGDGLFGVSEPFRNPPR